MVLKHIVQSETLSATCSSDDDSVNVYAELESSFSHDSDAVEGESQFEFSAPNESEDEPQDVPGAYERMSIQGLNA